MSGLSAGTAASLLVGVGLGLSGLVSWAFWRVTRTPPRPRPPGGRGAEPPPGSDYFQGHEGDPWHFWD